MSIVMISTMVLCFALSVSVAVCRTIAGHMMPATGGNYLRTYVGSFSPLFIAVNC